MRVTEFGEHHDNLDIGELRRRPEEASRDMSALRVPDCLPAGTKVLAGPIGLKQRSEKARDSGWAGTWGSGHRRPINGVNVPPVGWNGGSLP